MRVTKIRIENFKSIKEIEFDVKKYGNSYTTILLGVNEVGKSNILKAMSFFNTPIDKYNFGEWQNQKDEESDYVDLYFSLEFDTHQYILEPVKAEFDKNNLLEFSISNITKNVYLGKELDTFVYTYTYDVNITKDVYIRNNIKEKILELNLQNDEANSYILLDEKNFNDFFGNRIDSILSEIEPTVSFWEASEEYLITSNIDLKKFKENTNSNVPLKNIFALAGYDTNIKIKERIDEIENPQKRSKLAGKLSQETTKYIKNIWKHNISFVIDISETGNCTISVKDDGKDNEYDRHSMSARSEGFKQFMSLILSLSIETRKFNQKGRLILIDEPENHLHPSGIRDLSQELLDIGRDNFVFVSTHSPFLIDQQHKERHIIIKKDKFANTIKKEIKKEDDLRDDEVLSQAFGINIYKDLLNTKRILVEGSSDKKILQKAFCIENLDYGITNGHGSNIVSVASKFNDDALSMLVITDDDKDGKKYKADILKIKGVYSDKKVFTIRDLVGDIKNNGTIEDCLGKEYVTSQFNKMYKKQFDEIHEIILNDETPYLEHIKISLVQSKKSKEDIDTFLDNLKIEISDNIDLKNYDAKFPLLKKLIDEIKLKIE